MHIKLYNHLMEDMIINNLEKTVDKEISILFDHLETKNPC